MQDSASFSAHQAKATQNDPRNVVPGFAVEKTPGSNAAVTKTGLGPIQHIYS